MQFQAVICFMKTSEAGERHRMTRNLVRDPTEHEKQGAVEAEVKVQSNNNNYYYYIHIWHQINRCFDILNDNHIFESTMQ